MIVELRQQERILLFQQDPLTRGKGCFQALLVKLQSKTDSSGRLFLTNQLLERISRYAFGYGNGGWENRLVAIFGRVLGPGLNAIN